MHAKHINSPQDLILCELSHHYVKKRQFAGFLANWAPHKLPRGAALRPLLNKFVFRFQGFPDDQRRLCVNPEVRSFCRAFFEAWPFWFFAGNLDTPDLLIMVFGYLQKLKVLEQGATDSCQFTLDAEEFDEFVQRGLCAMTCLCKRAEMSESEITLRSMQVLEYFQTDWSSPSARLTDGDAGTAFWN